MMKSPSKSSAIDQHAKSFFIYPPLVILLVLTIYPTYYLIRLALSTFDVAYMSEPLFTGLQNFVQVLTDNYFWSSFGNTLIISGAAVVLEFLIGLGLALLLNEELRGEKIFRSLFIIPIMLPPVIVGLNFKLIFDTFGPVNGLLETFGLNPLDWLGNPTLAKFSIILADTWQWSPFVFIILLAGLQVIPKDLYDSAKVDGAGGWKVFRYITWPMLIPSVTLVLALRVIDALKIFDVIYMVTSGGPAFSTEVLSLYIYRTAFRFGSLGYASALAVIMLVILTFITQVIIRATRLNKRLEWGE